MRSLAKMHYALVVTFFLMIQFCGAALLPPPQTKIINGTEVTWQDGTRYQVSVRLKQKDKTFGYGHLCGGSLIASNMILTATHCLWDYKYATWRNASALFVVMGNLDRYSSRNVLSFDVLEYNKLATFIPETYVDDIALLTLNGSVPAEYAFAQIIPLNVQSNLTMGMLCQASGWGLTEQGYNAARLRTVDVALISQETCMASYGTLIKPGMLCAGYMQGERDACTGDSGGPLVCNERLTGIISYGAGCAMPGLPGVYTDVAYYAKWIQSFLNSSEHGAVESTTGFGERDDAVINGMASIKLIIACSILALITYSNWQ